MGYRCYAWGDVKCNVLFYLAKHGMPMFCIEDSLDWRQTKLVANCMLSITCWSMKYVICVISIFKKQGLNPA